MLVSIITVCYNSEKTIARTIESVLNQTYKNIEYIIVDGCSTDSTLDIVNSYAEAFNDKGINLKVVSEKDNGIYDAMNKGIRIANGEIVGIINSDDWYEPIAVETVADAYRRTNFVLYYADLNMWQEKLDSNGDSTLELKMVKHSAFRSPVVSRDWNHPTTFITKAAYDELGLYKCESLHDDWDLVLRIRRAGKKVVVENKILANFTLNGVSHDKSVSKAISRGKERYRIYRNNGYSRLYFIECVAIEVAKAILA